MKFFNPSVSAKLLLLLSYSSIFASDPTLNYSAELLPLGQGSIFSKIDGTVIEVNKKIERTNNSGEVVVLDHADDDSELKILQARLQNLQEDKDITTNTTSTKDSQNSKSNNIGKGKIDKTFTLSTIEKIDQITKKIKNSTFSNTDNYITSILVEKNQPITIGQKIYNYLDISKGVLTIYIDEDTYAYFDDKDITFVISNDANNQTLESSDYSISDIKDSETDKYIISIFIDNPQHTSIGSTFSVSIFEIE